MQALVQQWESAADRRAAFLSCYLLMTRNMLAAIDKGEFGDALWVSRLLHRFADYYFDALAAYDQDSPATPPVWRQAHNATLQPGTQVLQHLMLGVNAHINYDLVLTLVDLLEPEWTQLSPEERARRHADHCHVNDVIGRTIDAVQDSIIERFMPVMDIVDKLLGPIDELVVAQLLTRWREDVWKHALQLLEAPEPGEREHLRQELEATALQRAETILTLLPG
jgi:hypothetical protein